MKKTKMDIFRKLGKILHISFLYLLLPSQVSTANELVSYIDENKSLAPQQEWNRELVSTGVGITKCNINNSNGGLNILLLADRTYKALINRNQQGMHREDVIFLTNKSNGSFEGDINIPKAGSYWFILKNEAISNSSMSLKCFKNKT